MTKSTEYAKLDKLIRKRSGGKLKKISKKVLDKENEMRYNKRAVREDAKDLEN